MTPNFNSFDFIVLKIKIQFMVLLWNNSV
jgi:hypothetical protein